jgi:hypothetical protein
VGFGHRGERLATCGNDYFVPIEVTWAAQRWIRRHGRRIYVWATPAAAAYDRLHTSTTKPADGEYDSETVGDIEVFVEAALAAQEAFVRVERRVAPPWGIAASSSAQMGAWGTGP